jgi:hypothetical protein
MIGAVPSRVQHAHQCFAYALVVIYYEHIGCPSANPAIASHFFVAAGGDWQAYGKRGASSGIALRFDVAAVALNYAVAHCQPQTYSAGALRREEGFKYVITNAAGHSDPVVGEAYSRNTSSDVGYDLQPSALRHRVQGVKNDVDEHFSQLRLRPGHGWHRVKVKLDIVFQTARLRFVAPSRPCESGRILDKLVKINRFIHTFVFLDSKRLNSLYRLRAVQSGPLDNVNAMRQPFNRVFPSDQLSVSQYCREYVVEVVRDTRG